MSAIRKIDTRMDELLNEFYAETFEKGRRKGAAEAYESARFLARHFRAYFKDDIAVNFFITQLSLAERK